MSKFKCFAVEWKTVRSRIEVCFIFKITVFPHIVYAETSFLKVEKCGHFHIVFALWQFFTL